MTQVSPSPAAQQAHIPVGLWRRLAAIFYDLLVIVACLLIITAVATAFGAQFGKVHYPFYSTAILFLFFLYFGWFWTHGGQTVGMKVWDFRLYSTRHPRITWFIAISRYGSAFFSLLFCGIGFLWSAFNKKKCAWHDYFSDSYLQCLKNTNPKHADSANDNSPKPPR